MSDALGRRVEVGKIQAQLGWGVSVEVSGLTIADDPAFSTKPFLAADDVSVDIEFFPLLRGEAKVTKLDLIKPDIRLVMNARGDLNASTIGSNTNAQSGRTHKRSALGDLSIKALSVEDGAIYFNDLGEKMAPIHVRHLAFDVTSFNAALGLRRHHEIRLRRRPAECRGVGPARAAADSRRARRVRNSDRSQVAARFDPARQRQAPG